MEEKRTPSQEQPSTKPESYRFGYRFDDCYGGGSYAVARHTSESLGGYRGFNRDKPTGRLASKS
jgi:hypothetical protein